MISNIRKNSMGTTSFDGKFGKMRKAQDFIVYPINDQTETLQIQSENRFGIVKIADGKMVLSGNHGFANHIRLQMDIIANKAEAIQIPSDMMESLLSAIRGTSSPMAGNNTMHIFCDNSKAHLV
jgi:hypothetical protein